MEIRFDENPFPENVRELTEYLSNPTNFEYAINRALNNDFYGLKVDSIIEQKKKYASENLETRVDIPANITRNDVEEAAQKAVTSFRQANEYFFAAENVSLLTKPTLIFYGMVNYAKSLIFCTYKYESEVEGHGLTFAKKDNSVTIEKAGEFPRLHDCLRSELSIYLTPANEPKNNFTLTELLSLMPHISDKIGLGVKGLPDYDPGKQIGAKPVFELEKMGRHFSLHYPQGKKGRIGNIPLLEVQYLLGFGLCSQARYHAPEWVKTVESPQSYAYSVLLNYALVNFPLLIMSELLGTYLYYLPKPYLAGSADVTFG